MVPTLFRGTCPRRCEAWWLGFQLYCWPMLPHRLVKLWNELMECNEFHVCLEWMVNACDFSFIESGFDFCSWRGGFALDWFEKEFVCARWIRDGFAFDEFDMDIGGIAHRLDSNHCVLVRQTSFVIPRKDIQLEAALMPQSKEHSWWNRNHRSLILLTNWVIHFLNEKRFGSIECKVNLSKGLLRKEKTKRSMSSNASESQSSTIVETRKTDRSWVRFCINQTHSSVLRDRFPWDSNPRDSSQYQIEYMYSL